MTENQLDRVSIFGDQLSFLIPHDWVESDEDKKNYLYHAPGADSGWFRVSLLTLRTPETASPKSLEALLAARAEKEEGVLYRSGENIIAAWEKESEEEGIPIVNCWWAVGHCHGPNLSHEAMFSYTVLKEKRREPETQEMLNVLLNLVADALFTPPVSA